MAGEQPAPAFHDPEAEKNDTEAAEKNEKRTFGFRVTKSVGEAAEMLRTLNEKQDKLRDHPNYRKIQMLQDADDNLGTLRLKLLHLIRKEGGSDIPDKLNSEIRKELSKVANVHIYAELANFTKSLEKTKSLRPKKDIEKAVKLRKENIEEHNLLTIENQKILIAETNIISNDYHRLGNVTFLEKVVEEVGDGNGWYGTSEYIRSEGLREEALVHDAVQSVDIHLTEVGILLRQMPERVPAEVHEARENYHRETMRFAETLVGAGRLGEVDVDALYNPQLAEKYGYEAVALFPASIDGVQHAMAWIKQIDNKIGSWKSGMQELAGEYLFRGIREALNAKMEELLVQSQGHPDLLAEARRLALDMARQFRTEATVQSGGKNMIDFTIYHNQLENGQDGTFAAEMAEIGLGLEDLALERLRINLGKKDPLENIIRLELSDVRTKLEADERIDTSNSEIQSIMQRFESPPSSFQESCATFAEFRALQSYLKGKEPDQSAIQSEIEKGVAPMLKDFKDFLEENITDITNGKRRIGMNTLRPEQIECLSLLSKIEGYGMLLSDKSVGYVRVGGKIAGTIAIGVAVGVATGGLGIVAASVASGAVMTATNVLMEKRAVRSFSEGLSEYGSEFAMNTAGASLGRVLAGARYAAQLQNVDDIGMSAKQIFMESMKRGGMAKFAQFYDEFVGISARLAAAGVEGVVDATGSAVLDTAFQGGSFYENFKGNVMFLGLSIGMEFSSDVKRMLRFTKDASPQQLADINGALRRSSAQIAELDMQCNKHGLKGMDVYHANGADLQNILKKLDIKDVNQILRLRTNLKIDARKLHRQIAAIKQASGGVDLNSLDLPDNFDFSEHKALRDIVRSNPAMNDGVRLELAQKGLEAKGLLPKGMDVTPESDLGKAIIATHETYGDVHVELLTDQQKRAKGRTLLKALKELKVDNKQQRIDIGKFLMDAEICGKQLVQGTGLRLTFKGQEKDYVVGLSNGNELLLRLKSDPTIELRLPKGALQKMNPKVLFDPTVATGAPPKNPQQPSSHPLKPTPSPPSQKRPQASRTPAARTTPNAQRQITLNIGGKNKTPDTIITELQTGKLSPQEAIKATTDAQTTLGTNINRNQLQALITIRRAAEWQGVKVKETNIRDTNGKAQLEVTTLDGKTRMLPHEGRVTLEKNGFSASGTEIPAGQYTVKMQRMENGTSKPTLVPVTGDGGAPYSIDFKRTDIRQSAPTTRKGPSPRPKSPAPSTPKPKPSQRSAPLKQPAPSAASTSSKPNTAQRKPSQRTAPTSKPKGDAQVPNQTPSQKQRKPQLSPSSSPKPRLKTADYRKLSNALNDVAKVANTPEMELPEDIAYIVGNAQENSPIAVVTHTTKEVEGRIDDDHVLGYRTLSRDGIAQHEAIAYSEGYLDGANGLMQHQESTASNVCTESLTRNLNQAGEVSNDKERLIYIYVSDSYLDTVGRKKTPLKITVDLPTDQARQLYRYLEQNPDMTRPLFLMFSKQVKQADYLWNLKKAGNYRRIPRFEESDGQRTMLFCESDGINVKGDTNAKVREASVTRLDKNTDDRWSNATELPGQFAKKVNPEAVTKFLTENPDMIEKLGKHMDNYNSKNKKVQDMQKPMNDINSNLTRLRQEKDVLKNQKTFRRKTTQAKKERLESIRKELTGLSREKNNANDLLTQAKKERADIIEKAMGDADVCTRFHYFSAKAWKEIKI